MVSDSKSNELTEQPGETVHIQETPTPETQRNENGPPPLVINSIANAPDSKNNRKPDTQLWEKAAVLVAFGLLIVNWYQVRQTKRAADAAKSAAETANRSLMDTERSLAATSAAQCEAGLNSPIPPDMYLIIACDAGKVDATLLGGSFSASLRNPATEEITGGKQTFSLESQLISPGRHSEPLNFRVEGFSMPAYMNLSQEVIIEGYFIYDDGFGRQRRVPMCFVSQPILGSHYAYGGPTSHSCESARAAYERNIEQQKH